MLTKIIPLTLLVFAGLSASAEPLTSQVCNNLAQATCHPSNPALQSLSSNYDQFLQSVAAAKDAETKQAFFKQSHTKLLAQNAATVEKARQFVDKAKTALTTKIEKEIQNPEKSLMIERVQAMRFEPNVCTDFPAEAYSKAAAFYEHDLNVFTICPKLLMSNMTDAALAFIIGHEMSHGIDPCLLGLEVGKSGQKTSPAILKITAGSSDKDLSTYPYGSVLTCLRSAKSANAAKNPKHLPADLPGTPFQNNLCYNDQIGEAFSDWMSAEIFTTVTNGAFGNSPATEAASQMLSIYSTKCSDEEKYQRGFVPHPDVQHRSEGIAMVQPQIRRLLNCPAASERFSYCKPPSLKTSSNASPSAMKKPGVQ